MTKNHIKSPTSLIIIADGHITNENAQFCKDCNNFVYQDIQLWDHNCVHRSGEQFSNVCQ